MPIDSAPAFAGFKARLDAVLDSFAYVDDLRKKLRSILKFEQDGNELHAYVADGIAALVYSSKFDEATIIRSLIVESVSAFEQFFKLLVDAIVNWNKANASLFSELDERFQRQYIKASGGVLSHYATGKVNGVKFDFEGLLKGFGSCIKDEPKFQLEGSVFTISLGNPTSDRIKTVFERLGLADPFTAEFGQKMLDENCVSASSGRAAANKAVDILDQYLEDRNDIIHGLGAASPTQADLVDLIHFLQTFGFALAESSTAQTA